MVFFVENERNRDPLPILHTKVQNFPHPRGKTDKSSAPNIGPLP